MTFDPSAETVGVREGLIIRTFTPCTCARRGRLAKWRRKEDTLDCGFHLHPRTEMLLSRANFNPSPLQPRPRNKIDQCYTWETVPALWFLYHVQCARFTQRTAKRSQFSFHLCCASTATAKGREGPNHSKSMMVRAQMHILPSPRPSSDLYPLFLHTAVPHPQDHCSWVRAGRPRNPDNPSRTAHKPAKKAFRAHLCLLRKQNNES